MKSKAEIDKLIQDHKRLITSEAAKYAQFVPVYVVEAEAYKIAHKAAESFDPSRGFQFSTHLTNQLKKLRRISTKYGNVARLPENKQFKLHKVNVSEASLKEELGREPTLAELADVTGMSIVAVSHLLQNRKKEVNLNNLAYTPVFINDENDDWVNFVYHDLNERDRFIFEHKTGFGGKPELNNEAIAKQLGLSSSTVNNRVKIISQKLAEGWSDHGS